MNAMAKIAFGLILLPAFILFVGVAICVALFNHHHITK